MSSSPSGSELAGTLTEEYVPLNKLEEGGVSAVKVMICRRWDAMKSYGKYLSTEYILSDCEGAEERSFKPAIAMSASTSSVNVFSRSEGNGLSQVELHEFVRQVFEH